MLSEYLILSVCMCARCKQISFILFVSLGPNEVFASSYTNNILRDRQKLFANAFILCKQRLNNNKTKNQRKE